MAADSQKRVSESDTLFSFMVLLLVFSLFFPLQSVAGGCTADKVDEYLKVKYVHDGDTLHLIGGQKVRLIGINTPEVARDKKPAEPYGVEARDALRQLLKKGSRIGIQYGRERRDRHGRTLAHLYLEDGRSIQQWLLEKGYAMAIAVPPNLYNVDCYQQSERLARLKRQGLWRENAPKVLDVTALRREDRGFRLVKGRVTGIKRTKKWLWITFAKNTSLRIARNDERYFDSDLLDSLAQKEVIARGWLTQRKGRWSMRIRHSSSLKIVGD